MEYYTLKLCGLTRKLPITHVSKKSQLANFSILGDVELVNILADNLADMLRKYKFDYLVATEVKVVPLVHGVALRLGYKRFVVCRKSVKPYMIDPIIPKPLRFFPKHVKPMVIDGRDAKLLKGKKVIIADAVISTGVTMRMMKKLMEKAGAKVVKTVAILKQGEQFDPIEDLIYFEEIPVFKEES